MVCVSNDDISSKGIREHIKIEEEKFLAITFTVCEQ
jgi:hypothetical protein